FSHPWYRGPDVIPPGDPRRGVLLDDRRPRHPPRSHGPHLLAVRDRHDSGFCGGVASTGVPQCAGRAGMLPERGALLGTPEGRIYGAPDAFGLFLPWRLCEWTILSQLFPPTPARPRLVGSASPGGDMDKNTYVSLLHAATSYADRCPVHHCRRISD